MTFHRASEPRTRSPACKDRGRGRLTWPFAGEPLYGVSVSDPDSPFGAVRAGTPRARLPRVAI